MNEHPDVRANEDIPYSCIVRRYIDLPKYLDLLRSRSLYFRLVDKFPDRLEGALIPCIRSSIDDAYRQGKAKYNADYFCDRSRKGNFVSCWNVGDEDNMALWQLYGGASQSVAVKSTFEKLVTTALRWKEEKEVLIYKVRYIDHFENPDMIIGGYTDPLQFKHKAYSYERELRIIVPRQHDGWEKNPDGIRLPIGNLNNVIDSIVVAPEAEQWFYEIIRDVTQKYGVASPVCRSKLTYAPGKTQPCG